MSEDSKSVPSEQSIIEQTVLATVDSCMSAIDGICKDYKLDASAMIMMSVHVAAHLMARGLFLANGPDAREQLRTRMVDQASEILDAARQHIDQSERELDSMRIIRPN